MSEEELREYLEDVTRENLVNVTVAFYKALHKIKATAFDPMSLMSHRLDSIYSTAHKETDKFDFHY